MAEGQKFYHVTLTAGERSELQRMLSSGRHAARKLTHARVLLMSDSSLGGQALTDRAIHGALGVAISTIERVRQRFVEASLEAALVRKPTSRRYQRLLDGDAEARMTALACSSPPDGRKAWTAQLLSDELVVLGCVDSISKSTVQRALKKTRSSRG